MSYILDALKKSEQQRGALQTPAGQPVMVANEASQTWRFGLPVILVIVALLAGWLLAKWQEPIEQHRIEAESIEQSHAVGRQVVERDVTVVQKSDEKVLNLDTSVQSTSVQSAKVIHVDEDVPMFRPISPASSVTRAADVESQHDSRAARLDRETVDSLPIAEQQSMPEVKIEGHIYDADPTARMVIINGKVRREKQVISTGLILQEITADGVILQYHGKQYRMGVFDH